MKDKIVDEGYARLRKNMKYHVLDEFTYDIKIPGESKSLSEKFKTGEFILFGFVPEKGWVKVFYQSIGLLDNYKLIRKKFFPVVWICGNCAYFMNGACIHPNSRDNCGDSDSDRKCYHNGFASVPYNWDSYTCDEKEKFRLHKTIKKIKC